MLGIGTGRTAGCTAVVVLTLIAGTAAPASAQTIYHWTATGTVADWSTPANWNSGGGSTVPGVAGATGNTDIALFDSGVAAPTVSLSNVNSGYNLGAIETAGATGGLMTVNISGNGTFLLNGSGTIGSFTHVAAAAQNGRDLTIVPTNMVFAFGTSGVATTFYADAGRTLTIADQQITNLGGDVNKEGAGTLVLGTSSGATTFSLGSVSINVNGGTLAAHSTMNATQINVASGASLQAGLLPGGNLSTSATVNFANTASLRVLTDGTSVTQLQNAPVTKNPGDTFTIKLAGLSPTGTQSFAPSGVIIQANSLTGFDPNGTYTPSSPGHFAVVGDGFLVTNWSVTVLNGTQVRLDSMTVTPIPESRLALAVCATAVGVFVAARRQRDRLRTRDRTRHQESAQAGQATDPGFMF
jgi:hypothetical protein